MSPDYKIMKRKTGTKVMQEQTKENKLPVVLLAVIIVVLLVGSIGIGIFGGGGKILKLQERQQSFQMRGKFRRLQSTKILL